MRRSSFLLIALGFGSLAFAGGDAGLVRGGFNTHAPGTCCAHGESVEKSGTEKKESRESMDALLAKESYDPQAPLKSLGAAYISKSNAKNYEVRYCPDNTCEILRAPIATSKQVVDDFAFIYFARVSTYTSLQSYQKMVHDNAIEKVQAKYASKCPKSNGVSTTRCQLKELSSRYKIRLLFSRFDEGVESTKPIQIKE